MTVRVMLISPAPGTALRTARFDDGSGLDARGLDAARSAAGTLPLSGHVLVSPSLRCRQTAQALGLTASGEAPVGWAMGAWRGRTLDEVAAEQPDAVAAWLADPAAAPPGGESLAGLCERAAGWLDALAGGGGRVVAVVEPELVRAAVVHALGSPATAFWRLDVPPLTATELSGRLGRWNVRLGAGLGPVPDGGGADADGGAGPG
ncbi:histidine phosphatase family protein [Kitasatospora sp. NPDC050463]|uniref:histidine phosphatase family protein n=1 Tax=Kitasatospora sp. NPDC050463 TaxID=3155786 RepID=UPI0033CB005C